MSRSESGLNANPSDCKRKPVRRIGLGLLWLKQARLHQRRGAGGGL
jgi:hypothetical protein